MNLHASALALLTFICSYLTQAIYVITDFGALPHQDHRGAHVVNAKAFIEAVKKANCTING